MDRVVEISVIMGTYNPKEAFLTCAVQSVCNQTFARWELILCDDGSAPEHIGMIERVSGMDDRIRLIRCEENQGLASALNRCISLAGGRYIARMDDDDISCPERLEEEYRFLEEHKTYSWVGTCSRRFDDNGVWGSERMPEVPEASDFLSHSPYIHPSVMFRREVLIKENGYHVCPQTRRCEDYELFMRLHAHGYRGYNIQKPYLLYREDRSSYGKRTLRSRINEIHIRRIGFARLGLLHPPVLPYLLKPLAAYFVPAEVRRYLHRQPEKKSRVSRLQEYRRLLAKEQMCLPEMPEGPESYVFAPLLNSFVLWVLGEAQKNGVKRLYFLARDGYFMYRAAQIYAEKFHIPTELRYVSCSRYSLRIPMYHLAPQDALDYICRFSLDVTLYRILERAGLDKEEQAQVLADISMEDAAFEIIPYAELGKIREKLSNSVIFMEAMLRRSREAYPLTAGYLRQEGMLDGERDAIVDSGWVGSMQKTLMQILKAMGRTEPLEGYYWGLYELPDGVSRDAYHCYYFSPEGQLQEKVDFNNNLFESIFSAPHGSTLGYERRGDRFVPVYSVMSEKRTEQIQRTGDMLLSYIRKAAEQAETVPDTDSFREKNTFRKILRLFMTEPTREEADTYGSILFSDDVLEDGSRELAREMSEKEFTENHLLSKILILSGMRTGHIRESAWYEGSVIRFSKHPGIHLFQYRMYKYLLYIRQMYRWRKRNAEEKKREKYSGKTE